MLQHAQRSNVNASQTCRFFGVSQALCYIWKQRFENHAVADLRDLSWRVHRILFFLPAETRNRRADPKRFSAVRSTGATNTPFHESVAIVLFWRKTSRARIEMSLAI
jgi:hypothetical protein